MDNGANDRGGGTGDDQGRGRRPITDLRAGADSVSAQFYRRGIATAFSGTTGAFLMRANNVCVDISEDEHAEALERIVRERDGWSFDRLRPGIDPNEPVRSYIQSAGTVRRLEVRQHP